jgi:hypothetical protein
MKYIQIIVLTVLLSIFLPAALAQTSETDEPDRVIELEEVIISSQHGNQHLLDIPAAITAVGASMLNSSNIGGLEQLAGFVPYQSQRCARYF